MTVIDLDAVARGGRTACPGQAHVEDVAAVRQIVAEELAAQLSAGPGGPGGPDRGRAAGEGRPGGGRGAGPAGPAASTAWTPRARREIAQSMRRIADKLLHAPTVRVKELAGSPGGDSYEAVLRVLFDLDPDAVQAVTRAEAVTPEWLDQEAPK